MAVRQFLTGLTYSLFYHFRDRIGDATSVATPKVNIYTPQKTLYVEQGNLTAGSTTGEYYYHFFAPSGLTIGHYFSLGTGITDSSTVFSESVAFEIIDIQLEPFWVGYEEFRDFLELEDTDRDNEDKLKQALAAAIELVEGYTHRHYGIRQYDEIIEVKDTDRITLKRFPVDTVVAITATVKTIPRDLTNIIQETLTNDEISFYYRLDDENGIIKLLDSAGFDCNYDGILIGISYLAGFATVPEPVRQAALHLAAAINSLSCTEGIDTMRFADLSFSTDKQLFKDHIKEMLSPYRNNFQV
jgi:hypothetical protein